jgi:ribosomal protein S17E
MTISEAANLIKHFEPTTTVYVETEKSKKLRKDIFGYMKQLHAVAPHLGILLDDRWNQRWIKDFFLSTIEKEDIYTANEAERLHCYIRLKQMISGYTKKAVKEAKKELDKELDHHLSH